MRAYGRALVLGLLLACAVRGFLAQQQDSGVLTVQSLRLSGPDGTILAELKVAEGQVPTLVLRSGAQGVQAKLTPSGIEFGGDEGQGLHVGMQGVSTPLFPSILMQGPAGGPNASFVIGPYDLEQPSGGLVVWARDADGRERYRVGPDSNGLEDWKLRLWDKKGMPTVNLPELK